ncbi:MAG: aspartyl/asparaginyl beta-hydroxylase domain-containing protein [Chitinophagaceae bacterium]
MKKLCFSILERKEYQAKEPFFVEVSSELWASKLKKIADEILEEYYAYIQSHKLQPYFKQDMVSENGKWETVSLKVWGITLHKHQLHFPAIKKWLNEFDEVLSVSINVLSPNASIHPHYGDTNAIYRVHFGLIIPEGLPNCGIQVGNTKKPWKEFDFVAFNDCYTHSVWNYTNQSRLVIVIDILKKDFYNKKKFICSMVLTGLWLQKVATKFTFLYKLPMFVQKMLIYCLLIPVYCITIFKIK